MSLMSSGAAVTADGVSAPASRHGRRSACYAPQYAGGRLLGQQRVGEVVAPVAVDVQVAAQQTLLAEAEPLDEPPAAHVLRADVGLHPVQPHRAEGVVEFAKLLFTAKYAYFNMLSGTLIGIAIGMWLRDALKAQRSLDALAPIGGACVLAAIVMASHAGESSGWWVRPVPTNAIWRWVFYTGFVLLALVGLRRLLERYNAYGGARKYAFQLHAVCGSLAFPLFVTHQLVIPLKDILVQLTGLPQAPLLVFSMGLFLLSGWAMYRKVHAMNFRA